MGVKKVRGRNRYKPYVFVLTVLLVVIVIIGVILAVYLNNKNYINLEINKYTPTAEAITKTSTATTIIVNNLVLGGVYEGNWIPSRDMYQTLKGKENLNIAMFDMNGKLGTFRTATFKSNGDIYYTTTTKLPAPEKYIATTTENKASIYSAVNKINTNDEDINNIKKALGKYKFLNNTVKINEAYSVALKYGELGKLYTVTSESARFLGVYSALVYSNGTRSELIRYSYVKNTDVASAWPVYSILFVIDINGDGTEEIVLQETTTSTITYSVITCNNENYMEVLSQTINL